MQLTRDFALSILSGGSRHCPRVEESRPRERLARLDWTAPATPGESEFESEKYRETTEGLISADWQQNEKSISVERRLVRVNYPRFQSPELFLPSSIKRRVEHRFGRKQTTAA